MSTAPIDLGHGHSLEFYGWHPDRELNPQYDGIEDVDRFSAAIEHPAGPKGGVRADGTCVGQVTFDSPTSQKISPHAPKWTVESWEPLTISPSVLCACGDHGFIRDGQWMPA